MAFLGHLYGQPGPALAIIPGAVKSRRFYAHKNRLCILWVDGYRPDGNTLHGRPQLLPRRAFIFTAIDAVIRSSQYPAGVVGVRCQRPHLASQWERVSDPVPVISPVWAVPNTAAESHGAHANTVVVTHSTISSEDNFIVRSGSVRHAFRKYTAFSALNLSSTVHRPLATHRISSFNARRDSGRNHE